MTEPAVDAKADANPIFAVAHDGRDTPAIDKLRTIVPPTPSPFVKRRKPVVIVIGSDKGGVGKTTIGRVFDDWLQEKSIGRRVFDAEFPRGDLKRFVPGSQIVNIEDIEDQMRVFDTIDGVTMIDVKAGLLSSMLRDLDRVKLLNDVRAGKLDLIVMHVIGPSAASLDEISTIVRAIGKGVTYLLVKNYISEAGFTEWNDDPRFSDLFRANATNTITIPHLIGRATTEVQQLGVSFDSFRKNGGSRMLTGFVDEWMDGVYAEFDRIKLLEMVAG